jgi:predicted MFS family arabinose efflux permease
MNKQLKSLFIVNSVFIFAAGLVGPLYTLYIQGFNNDPVAIGAVPTVFMLCVIFFTFILMQYGDSFKKKGIMLSLGFLLRSVSWIFFMFITTYIGLLLVQILLALGESLGSPAFESLVAEHLDNAKHIKEYSMWRIISNVTGACSTLLGGLIVKYYGFSNLFGIMAVISLFCFLYSLTRVSTFEY